MLKNYWLLAIRKLWKNRIHAAINIIGLAVGLTSCLIIFIITHYELSYDRFHPNGDRIYRVVEDRSFKDQHAGMAAVQGALASTFRNEVTGCQIVSGVLNFGWQVIIPAGVSGQQAKTFDQPQGSSPVILADPQYFQIFPYQWLVGNPATSLNDPFKVVLSAKQVTQYFGNITPGEAIGREVVYVGFDTLRVYVSGVVQDWDRPTDLAYTDFISYATAGKTFLRKTFNLDTWNGVGTFSQAYVLLDKGTTAAQVQRQFPALVEKYIHEGPRATTRISLQPLKDIHFNEAYRDDSRKAHLPTLYGLMGIAVFILLLAVINFVNLSTAQSLERAKEVGIRKVMGSRRLDIAFQFLGETFILTLLAVILSLLITPPVMSLLHVYMPPGLGFQFSTVTVLFLLGITIATSLLAGWYPAKVISALLPVLSLKGQATRNLQPNRYLHRGLIIFQFTISLIFIIATVIVARQLHYVLNTGLGFDKDAIISFDTYTDVNGTEVLAQRLRTIPGIAVVSRNAGTPQADFHVSTSLIWHGPVDETVETNYLQADTNYLRVFGLRLVAGRNFIANDSVKEFVINETMARQFGFRRPQDAIGQPAEIGKGGSAAFGRGAVRSAFGAKGTIVGVLRDFHTASMHKAITPIFLYYERRNPQISIRLTSSARQPEAVASVMAEVQKAWHADFPNDKLSYTFFDETIANLYKQEQRLAGLMRLAMIIAISISCMGLLGLATFTAQQRQKEISIRKVLGAGVSRIFTMLTIDFVWPVSLAFLIAAPIAWYFMHGWLQGFVYRATVPWWIFGICGLAAVTIAILTVGLQSIRAAIRNPVDSLRTE